MALDFPSSPTNGQTYTANNVTWEYSTSTTTWNLKQDGVAGKTRVAIIRDQKNSNVDGGYTDKVSTGENGSWNDRDLTVKDDPFSFVTLYPTANGQTTYSRGKTPGYFSLPAGTYKIRFKTGGIQIYEHLGALIWSKTQSDISSAYDPSSNPASSMDGYFYGTTALSKGYNPSASIQNYDLTYSTGSNVVTITETTYFKVIHFSNFNPGAEYAFGSRIHTADNIDKNNYTIIEVEDLATAVKEPTGTDIPVGGIIMYSGTDTELNALTNWKLCDGTTYGSVTTPNLKDKFVIGADQYSSGWKTNVTGSLTPSGGSKDAVIVRHKHSITDPGHAHDIKYTNTHMNAGTIEESGSGESGTNSTESNTTGITDTDHEGVVGTDKNLPPYFALAYIMKIS